MPVPAELIDNIIGQVEDRASLESCCLAASVFVHPCQKRLHASLKLTLSPTTLDFWALAAYHFQKAPHLTQHVIHLTITLEKNVGTETEGDFDPDIESTYFARFDKLQTVTIAGMGRAQLPWATFPETAASAVAALLMDRCTRPLKSIKLVYFAITVPVVMLCLDASETLELVGCITQEIGTVDGSVLDIGLLPTGSRPPAKSIIVSSNQSMLELLATSQLQSRLRNIHSLSIRRAGDEVEAIVTLLTVVAPTIRKIRLPSMIDKHPVMLSSLGFPSLPSSWRMLRILKITIDIKILEQPLSESWIMMQIAEVILSPGASPQLTELVIETHVEIKPIRKPYTDADLQAHVERRYHPFLNDGGHYSSDEELAVTDVPPEFSQPISYKFDAATLAALDSACTLHTGLATLRFLLEIDFPTPARRHHEPEEESRHPYNAVQFSACRDQLEAVLSQTTAVGRLTIENQLPARYCYY
ncbi:hypothetical protein MIND_00980000 [Mycena indigotica]|uniref:Uncharacterized protein n=1 Tax=Mycena indigotica TaxID=2126181 RepID=A0A8H6SDH9_9AGAR|nr:uncharacterized protein MIND_00980000 [Mycena indigotica]KAF7297463.1 hypothetical protein MIND_00980000 [Mycena indigotica]